MTRAVSNRLRLHSRLNAAEARETLQKQPCADEKNEREVTFDYDERVTDAGAVAAGDRTARSAL